MNSLLRTLTCAAFTAAALGGCGSDQDTSKLSLSVTDAPVDGAVSVVITFTGVELQPQDGDRIEYTYDAPRQIDLLALQGGLSQPLLDEVEVESGEYAWIRLKVAATPGTTESFVQLLDGSIHPISIPSGAQSGLKLNGGMTVAADGSSSFTVDFDLRKSLHDPRGGSADYLLRPTLRLVDDQRVGSIAGTVDPLLLPEGCTPAVYAFSGTVTPDDEGGSGADPFSSAGVSTDPISGTSSYALAFLPVGDYTVAFTCQAAADAPDADDAILFEPVVGASVTAGVVTTLDLVPVP